METPPTGSGRAAPAGVLYVVATPIGNLDDLGARARRVLAEVDVVLAEDTRHTAGLLAHGGIRTPTESLHEHNERDRAEDLAARVEAGASMALVSDAGTPLISDPGYHVVRAMHRRGLRVVPVPGPCALSCALSVAGLPTTRFTFEGFLPARGAARRARLEVLSRREETLVFYEAPHRVRATLDDLLASFGPDRPATVARELTKVFETVRSATLGELAAEEQAARGEYVIVVAGATAPPPALHLDEDSLLGALLEALSPGEAARVAARVTGLGRNELYRRALRLKDAASAADRPGAG